MRRFARALLAGSLSVALAASVAIAVTEDESTGKGAYLENEGTNQNPVWVTKSISFKAGIDDLDVVYGELQQRDNGPGTSFDRKFHAEVLCYFPLSATEAAFAGIVDSSSDPSLVGDWFFAEVVDAGEPATGADQYGLEFPNNFNDCDDNPPRVELFYLVRGNIQVH